MTTQRILAQLPPYDRRPDCPDDKQRSVCPPDSRLRSNSIQATPYSDRPETVPTTPPTIAPYGNGQIQSTPVSPTPTPTIPALEPDTTTDISRPISVGAWDVLILITYFVCIIAAISRIINSFNDEYAVQLDGDALKETLTEQNLQDIVNVSFKFDKRYEFGKDDKLKKFGINIANKSKTHSIYVDWDYCTMTDLEGRSRRVTRLMPGTTLDLFQSQAFSAIAPETTLKETITAEDVLKRKDPKDEKVSVALEMEADKPLLDFEGLNKGKGREAEKRRYTRFVTTIQTLEFSLDLALRFVGSSRSAGDHAIVRCKFILQKLPWQAGLPWNPKD